MSRAARKYVLDTQLFIHGFRDPAANEALQQFHRDYAPFEYVSVIVAQELRAGIRSLKDRRALERHVLGVFERANRVIVPSPRAWHASGDVLSELARSSGLEGRVSQSFANDVLLAVSCAEAGCVLVTENRRDFERIRRVTRFDFVSPWPRAGSGHTATGSPRERRPRSK